MDKLDVLVGEKKEKKDNKASLVKTEISKTSCRDLENKFIFVRVGDIDRPATDEQVGEVRKELDRIFAENGIDCLLFVTHHAVSIEIIEKKGV